MMLRTLTLGLLLTPFLCLGQDVVYVTNLLDAGPGSFRQAIAAAFDSDTVRVQVSGTITLTTGSIVYDKTLVIEGTGMDALFISGSDLVTPLVVSGGSTTISGLTLRDGSEGSGIPGVAGGMAFAGDTLHMRDVRITECRLTGSGGNVRTGGGLRAVAQQVRIHDCEFTLNNILPEASDNGAARGGGAYIVSDDVLLRSTTISGNIARGRQNQFTGQSAGGGLYLYGNGRVENCTIIDNIARANTYYGGGPDVDAYAHGGGLFLEYGSEVTVSGGSISGNATEVSADGDPYQYGAGVYGSGVLLTVENCTLNNNSMPTTNPSYWPAEGGAIYTQDGRLTVRNCTLDGNAASNGSGIFWSRGNNFFGQHQVRVERTRVLNGTGDPTGGAISVSYADALRLAEVELSGNQRRGLHTRTCDTLRVDRCLFHENGGGAHLLEMSGNNAFLNTTFHRNGADQGAAVFAEQASPFRMNNCTLVDDTLSGLVPLTAGREIYLVNSSATLRNTILTSTAFQSVGVLGQGAGTIISGGGNISRDNSAASYFTDPTDLNNANPQLDSFADHGGFTRTWSLAANSTSIDQGGSDTLIVDQRGFLRDGSADAGAFEFGGLDTQQIFLTGTSTDATVCVGGPLAVSVQASSSATIGYQWLLDGTAIAGANASTYTTTATFGDEGTYTCVLTTAGDTLLAGPMNMLVEVCTGMGEPGLSGLRAWPVPADDVVHVAWSGMPTTVTYTLVDATGRVVGQGSATGSELFSIDLRGVSSGAYVVRLEGAGSTWTIRVVK